VGRDGEKIDIHGASPEDQLNILRRRQDMANTTDPTDEDSTGFEKCIALVKTADSVEVRKTTISVGALVKFYLLGGLLGSAAIKNCIMDRLR
jgi:hypothetical protein